ncbi:MAG: glucose 1-dehydrogenase [bacterium]|nr:glucose 1-dehydrogenase [bacterium]
MLQGRRAVVTGAASGIGAAISRRYALEGASVALVDRDGEGIADMADRIHSTGSTAIPVRADLVSTADLGRAMEESVHGLGGVGVLVNCAGVGQRPKLIEDTGDAEFDRIFAVNVRSVFLLIRAALPYLAQSNEPVIVNIASNISIRPRPGYAAYTASKGAVASLTRSLALELAPRNIRVVALCPAASDTPMLVEFMGGANTTESRSAIAEAIPMGRLVQPDEVAGVAAWAASEDARMVTGELISVDGGRGL